MKDFVISENGLMNLLNTINSKDNLWAKSSWEGDTFPENGITKIQLCRKLCRFIEDELKNRYELIIDDRTIVLEDGLHIRSSEMEKITKIPLKDLYLDLKSAIIQLCEYQYLYDISPYIHF